MSAPTSTQHPRALLPYLGVLGAIIGWGVSPLFVKGITASAPTIVFYRVWLAQPVMIGIAYATGGRLSWSLVRRAVPAGLCFAASIIFSFESFQKTSIATATLIPSLQPALMLLVAGALFGERRTRREVLLAAVAFAGIAAVVLSASSGTSSVEGDLYAVGNLLVFATYFVISKHLRNQDVHPWALIATVFLITAVVVTPWCLLASTDLGAVSGADWVWLAGLVFVAGVGGHGLMTWAHRYLDVTLTSTLTLGNPVIAAVGAWLVFSQRLNASQIAGIVVTLLALGAIVRSQTRDRALGAEAALGGALLDEVVEPAPPRSGPRDAR